MTKNMGSTDKTIRIILAILFGILYFTETVTGAFGVILIIFGVIFLLTSFISFCPLYAMFKISILKKENKK
ncbi:MAG: DUF2892 domain-containing protein [Bacteroidota bacterium]|nr:DUF2892 domain-containing protein [Bacteroidota bacterium]